jgi:asparagine synthase (glutamine-hydrolysing)
MCGICGVLNLRESPPADPDLLRRMVGALAHRGPDDSGGYRDDWVALGQTRLSIIDLSGGSQPMANEDQSLWVVFNGEIYNYLELAEELRAAGHRFQTKSDTEVILHAYEEWGLECVERFNGQWAFALWNRPARRLVLARDRVGVRPLYYTQVGGRLLFASEMKAILQDPNVPRAFDLEGLAQIFTFWAPVAPRSVLAGIRQVRPGAVLTVEHGRLEERVMWRPRFLDEDRPFSYADDRRTADLAVELRDRLEQATRLRMLRADVPVGVYLSGGLDSSVIGALVRRFHGGPLRTFSVRFESRDFDEGQYQAEMVRRLGTDHTDVEVGYADIRRVFPEVIWYAETPVLRAAPAPLYSLSALVRRSGYKVVLTGEGSDEFLAGYDLFRENKVRRFWARDPASPIRPRLLERLYPWLSRSPAQAQAMQRAFFGKGMDQIGAPHFSHIPRWDSAASLQRLFSADTRKALSTFDPTADLLRELPPDVRRFEPLGKAQYLEILTLLSGYLLSSQGDRMLMGNSVEGRFPFLDHQVMEFADALPPEVKLRVLDEKHVLKRAARDLVPESILKRPKQPYRAPDAQSFVQDAAPDYVDEVLSPAAITDAGIFDPVAVPRLLEKCRRTRDRTPANADNMALLGVLSTQLVHHLLLRGHGPVGPAPAALGHWYDWTALPRQALPVK